MKSDQRKFNEFAERVDKADERIKKLFKKYPLVGSAVFLAGFAIGAVLGKWAF